MKTKEAASLGSVPLLIAEVVFLALAVVAVPFRFLSRLCIKNRLRWDDFWIVAALVLFWVHQSLQLRNKPAFSHQWPLTDAILGLANIKITTPRHVILDEG